MELVTPNGAPAVAGQPIHEPRVFRRQRDRLNEEFKRILQEYIHDRDPKEDAVVDVIPDLPALRRRYGHEYLEIARKVKEENVGMVVDPDDMFKRIDQMEADLKRKQMLTQPLDEEALAFFSWNQ